MNKKSNLKEMGTNIPVFLDDINNYRILYLTLSKLPFDLMINDNKKFEYRKPSEWIKSRLIGKEYDFVKFVNGYGKDKPYFIAEYKGYFISEKETTQIYPNLIVKTEKGDIIIRLGNIVKRGNLNG